MSPIKGVLTTGMYGASPVLVDCYCYYRSFDKGRTRLRIAAARTALLVFFPVRKNSFPVAYD